MGVDTDWVWSLAWVLGVERVEGGGERGEGLGGSLPGREGGVYLGTLGVW